MKLLFMKSKAVDHFKTNMDRLFTNYYVKNDGSWMDEEYPEAFEEFIEVDDIRLADPDQYTPGELEVENCKILYSALMNLSPSQAADERLWAGLCNRVFYDYLKRRWANYELGREKGENVKIKKRFFVEGARSGLYSNSLARWWWIGKATYDPLSENHWEKLEAIGPADFSTKVFALFSSYTFSSNPSIMDGILSALKELNDHKVVYIVKKHLRPAMKYLNAYGGSILLDSLSSEEIKKILLKKILELRYGEDATIDYSVDDYTEPIEEDDDDEEIVALDNTAEEIPKELEIYLRDDTETIPRVDYLDKVRVIRVKDMKEMPIYSIPHNKEALAKANIKIIQKLIGKKMYDEFMMDQVRYKIIGIEKN